MIAYATPPPVPCEPDVLCAVVRETARSGWPHRVTPPEQIATMRRVLARVTPSKRAGIACVWPLGTPARVSCAVSFPRRASVRVRVRVFEDGSFRVTRMGGK